VNREYYPVTVVVRFGRAPGELLDLATGKGIETGQTWKLTLGAYELRSVALPSSCGIECFEATIPFSVREGLLRDARRTLSELASLTGSGQEVAGRAALAEGIRAAVAEGRFAWLRRALGSYPVLRCRELLGRTDG